jgi:hypothetical protein
MVEIIVLGFLAGIFGGSILAYMIVWHDMQKR